MNIKRYFLPFDNWLYIKIYTGRTFCDQLLTDILTPAFDQYTSTHTNPLWFFIRYNSPRDHLRLRFQTQTPEPLLKTINSLLEPYLEQGVVWEIELSVYKRELERYLPENIETCEKNFANESVLVQNLLKQHLPFKEYTLLALVITNLYIDAIINDPKEKLAFLSKNYLAFKTEMGPDKKTLRHINFKFSELLPELISFDLKRLTNEHPYVLYFLAQHKTNIASLTNIELIAADLIHMLVNRIFHSDTRLMEMILYHHLEKLQKKAILPIQEPNIKPITI